MEINENNPPNSIGILPSFGSSASFSSINNEFKFGDNIKQITNKGINSLNMTLNLSFEELTDIETTQILSFLHDQFKDEPQSYSNNQSIPALGGSFTNKRVDPFLYQPFYPYKQNRFTCINYNHNKNYYNSNNVSASFECIAPSVLMNTDNGPDYNDVLGTQYNASEDGELMSLSPLLTLGENNYLYHPGGESTSNNYKAYKFISYENGNSIKVEPPMKAGDGEFFSNAYTRDNLNRSSIFINNPQDCSFYPYKPKTIRKIGGQDVLEEINMRMFDFRPSNIFSVNHSPKLKASNVTDFYKKYNKYGMNSNLNVLSLEFNGRSDIEAKRILLFLEAHLGYKKFGFHLQKDYRPEITSTGTHKNYFSAFFCPEWNHTVVYKDNHDISVTFVESFHFELNI